MRKVFLIVFIAVAINGYSQDLTKFHLYTPEENAETAIAKAVAKAKAGKKHVFIQIGGNWCIWCARFNDFVTTDSSVDSLIRNNYIVYHMNYSPENKNEKLLAKYGFPQRFGFPVFLILNGEGKLLHTQNSSYLEEGKGYSKKNVTGFLTDWTPAALDPKQYKE
ncbi:MAG: thioredoxin family protein [Chitinophagaceae bacterium]